MFPKLCEKLCEQNITQTDLANLLNIPERDIYLKFQGILQWDLAEVVQVCEMLHTPDADLLFCTV